MAHCHQITGNVDHPLQVEVVALAAAHLDALYAFLTDTVGALDGVTVIDTPRCRRPSNARA
ncbi:hypothetical protein ACFQ6S_19690 [Streptomyces sp. NPDC056479]|uniref:hypothetical protein n=1 Tax=Streptomyces sp. NPDC056479 TaxID=3345832 RepID=UPI003694941B